MNSTMETIYRKIELEGVWLVDPKLTTREQQDAILALRKAGKIEQAAYGVLKVKRDWRTAAPQPSPERDVVALLVAAGVPSERIGKVMPTQGRWLRPGPGVQYTVALDKAGGLAQVDKSAFAEWVTDGSLLIVRLKVA